MDILRERTSLRVIIARRSSVVSVSAFEDPLRVRFRQTYRVVPSGRFAIRRMPFAVAGSRWARHPRLPRVVPARAPTRDR